MINLKISSNEAGQRLDRYLRKLLINESRTNIYKMIRKKQVKVNGKREKEQYFLKDGDEVSLYLYPDVYERLTKVDKEELIQRFDLDIVYEDEQILIVNKPAGLLTHPDQQEYQKTLASYVAVYLQDYRQGTFKPASIQRLDKNTSGLVVFAKDYETLKRLNEQMRHRQIEKYYQTIVHGVIRKSGQITGYLLKDEETNKVTFYDHEKEGSKYIHTSYRPLKTSTHYTLLEVELHTGRTHQIRSSLEAIGHPIVGDRKYGGKSLPGLHHQVLHAYKVVIEGKVYEKWSEEIEHFIDEELKP